MDADSQDIDKILANLLTDYLLDGHQKKTNDPIICKTEPIEPTNLNVPQNSTTTNNIMDDKRQQYCLIIFNNPKWSQLLKKKQKNTSQQNEQQQPQQDRKSTVQVVKDEAEDLSVDDRFIIQLRHLINEYIQQTTRPLPLKYFLDFTDL